MTEQAPFLPLPSRRERSSLAMAKKNLFVFALATLWIFAAYAQEKQSIQVRTFDQKLQPLRNLEVSFNGKEYFSVGQKGVAVVEINSTDLPIKSIKLKDE